jgi:hypothetical protein
MQVRLAALALAACAHTPAEPPRGFPKKAITVTPAEDGAAPPPSPEQDPPAQEDSQPASDRAATADAEDVENPLAARATSLYMSRIAGFLRQGFTCPSLPAGAVGCPPTATFVIGADGTVTSVAFTPCGEATVDAAASAAATSKVGQQIPPPPADYSHLLPRAFSVTYVCKKL